MAKRILSYLCLSLLSAGFLSVNFKPGGNRGIACIDPVVEANILPLSGSLFGEIQDEALRKSTLDYYLFLSKVELQALAGRQAVFSAYGMKNSSPVSLFPQIQNFQMGGNTFANGFLWGELANGQKDSLSVEKNQPSLSIPPYSSFFTSAKAAGPAGAMPAGIGGGIALPSANIPNHKIGM